MRNEKRERLAAAWAELLDGEDGDAGPAHRTQVSTPILIHGGTVFVGSGNLQDFLNGGASQVAGGGTTDRTLDTWQTRRILSLRDQIVAVAAALEGTRLSPAAVLRKLCRAMRVEFFTEISRTDFPKAETYLVRWRNRLENMPGGLRVCGWRDRRMRAIRSKCKDGHCEEWRRNFMLHRFAKETIDELTNAELDRLYKAVMGRTLDSVNR